MLPCTIRPSILEQPLRVGVGRHMCCPTEGEEDAAHDAADAVAIEFWC